MSITRVGVGAQVASGSGDITPGFPAAYSAVADDVAVAWVVGKGLTTGTEPAAPSGWTRRSKHERTIGSRFLQVVSYYRVLEEGDTAPTFVIPADWANESGGGISGQIVVYRGVDPSSPFDAADVLSSSGAATTFAPTGITTASNNAVVVSAVAANDDVAIALSVANGFTAYASGASYDTTLGGDHSVALADITKATAGAQSGPTWATGAAQSEQWVGITFALKEYVAPANQSPTAEFTHTTDDLTADFTDTSTDADGSVVAWSWDFGDGSPASTLQNPSHTYASADTYVVTLTVTDDDAAQDQVQHNVTVTDPPAGDVVTGGITTVASPSESAVPSGVKRSGGSSVANNPPVAGFTWEDTGLSAAFTDTSTDSDGVVAARLWTFGDGNTSTERNPTHVYAAAGTYTVTLTAVDNRGKADVTSAEVTVSELPSVTFTYIDSGSTDLSVEFIGEPGTPVVAWDWDLGDGNVSTESSFVHTYAAPGTYTVTVTVTDSEGREASATRSVVVEEDVEPDPDPEPSAALPFLVLGARDRASTFTRYPWWNAHGIDGLTPSNCVTVLNGYSNNNMPCIVRLWTDAGSKDPAPEGSNVQGIFNLSKWKQSVDRYKNAGHQAFLNGLGAAGIIIGDYLMDDIKSVKRWGREITLEELAEMEAYLATEYPDIPIMMRARTQQMVGGTYTAIDRNMSIYLFGRGGVKQGTMTQKQWRIADCTAYRDRELADRLRLNIDVSVGFGLNIVDGGDGSSGLPGEISGRWRMGAEELRDYMEILVPASTNWFSMWEVNDDAGDGTGAYLGRQDIQNAMNDIRDLCDAQGTVEQPPPTGGGIQREGISAQVANTGDVTASWPVGYTPTAGHFAIAFVVGKSTSVPFQPAAPTGWTHRKTQTRGTVLSVAVYHKVLVGADAAPTFVMPAEWASQSVQIVVFSGVHATTQYDVSEVGSNEGSQLTFQPTGLTTQTAGARVVSFVAAAGACALALSTENNFVGIATGVSYDTTIGSDHAAGIAEQHVATAGAVTGPVWSQTVNGPKVWAGITVALRPA